QTTTSIELLENEIKHKKKIEKDLRKSEDQYRSLVETTSDFIWEVDLNGIFIYASPKIEDLLGYEPQEVTGKTPFDFMPADEAERASRLFRNIVDTRESFDRLENTNIHKDGRLVMLETSGVPILDDAGNLIGYRGMDRDITERKQAEKELGKYAKTQEVLVQEVNHRVKNNISAIIGMLYKEQDRTEAGGKKPNADIFSGLIGRIEGLSTAHSLLSQSGWQPMLLSKLCEQVITSVIHC
ncbi:MAG: PAS domain S-box protein, partial [Deltaproteobacteria bacterium]|nr:PAS domain S-box protein [Deltaproteobacteria bacterium]